MTLSRILLVEDDVALRSSLRFVLTSAGYEVMEAGDGVQALDALEREALEARGFDLLITDIRMPNMDGVELLQHLNAEGRNIPAMVISGHGDSDLLIDLLRLGCADYLAKPFEPDEVLDKVGTVLEKLARKQQAEVHDTTMLRDATLQLDRQARFARQDMERLEHEVQSAARAYRDLIESGSLASGLDVELRNKSYNELGGDFAGSCCDGTMCSLLVADVAGHDLAASYQTVLVKSFFDEHCRAKDQGDAFFHKLNDGLRENGSNERMVTAVLMQLDLDRWRGRAFSAGHPDLIRFSPEQLRAEVLTCRGDVLGLHEDLEFEPAEFDIAPGDRFFLYTDGLTGARKVDGPSGQVSTLSAAGLVDLVETFGYQALDRQVDAIWRYAIMFCRGKQVDDMLLMGVEVPNE